MKKRVKCSVCGKEVTEECMFIAMNLEMTYSFYGDLDKSAGPYRGQKYYVCYECWLKRMGVDMP
jgi:hypothetical protein